MSSAPVQVVVKWNKQQYDIQLDCTADVMQFKMQLFSLTGDLNIFIIES